MAEAIFFVASNATDYKTYFEYGAGRIDASISYQQKVARSMKKIWLYWLEDITQLGHLRNLLVESALEEPSIRTLDAVAKIAQQHRSSKNSTIRYMKEFFDKKDDGSQKLTPKDLSEINTNLQEGTIDLQGYGNSELSLRDLRVFSNAVESGQESDSRAGDTITSGSDDLPDGNLPEDEGEDGSSESGNTTPTPNDNSERWSGRMHLRIPSSAHEDDDDEPQFLNSRQVNAEGGSHYVPTPPDPYGDVQLPLPSVDLYRHHVVDVEYSVLDRFANVRRFDPMPESEVLPQLFAYVDSLHNRNFDNEYKSLEMLIVRGADSIASTVVWKTDPVAQLKHNRFIDDHLYACTEDPRRGWKLKVFIKPIVLSASVG